MHISVLFVVVCNTHEYMQPIYADLIFEVQYGSHKSLKKLAGIYVKDLKSQNGSFFALIVISQLHMVMQTI